MHGDPFSRMGGVWVFARAAFTAWACIAPRFFPPSIIPVARSGAPASSGFPRVLPLVLPPGRAEPS